MNNKKILKNIAVLISFTLISLFPSNNYSYAAEVSIQTKSINTDTELNFWHILNFFWDYFDWKIPESYQYISLNFKWVEKDTELYRSLQKLVYLDRLENKNTFINPNRKLSQYAFFKLSEKVFEFNANYLDKELLKTVNTTQNEIEQLESTISHKSFQLNPTSKKEVNEKKSLFSDIYSTLLNEHFNKENLKETEIIEAAIEWLAKWTKDKHTVYFPPTESESFYDVLSWEYEWIGSYVDMEKPWLVKIVSPISWSPSQTAWLKWWDIIVAVYGKEVTKENSLAEVVSWIKGPASTTVTLSIKRWTEILEIKVVREKIILKDVETKLLDYNTFYIEIKSFWDNVEGEFKQALTELKKQKYVNKVIIDLRNNGWWYLVSVSDMLWYFLDEWEPTAVIKYNHSTKQLLSSWYDLIDFSNYKIILLQNSGTASASEIMIGTIKDYYPNVEIIWEKSYWKWSVQTLKNYSDGSTIKYTIAKWFTWLTQTWIDWVWIEPTLELEFNIEEYQKNWLDNQLEKAKSIR